MILCLLAFMIKWNNFSWDLSTPLAMVQSRIIIDYKGLVVCSMVDYVKLHEIYI